MRIIAIFGIAEVAGDGLENGVAPELGLELCEELPIKF
jgi:hypothetical protein